ncbi:RNA ligase [Methanobacterium alcaliphilum]|uniref:RNA ligase n=1 Tax=Methanobacterium alcaliphilum TaxID=392018 RepID=UPI00200B31E4|nr:RNA ligase [Methanobacterium alcaliphilum]MCK9151469.1 RNA ligase [Methanobacterium alcaliphilum]
MEVDWRRKNSLINFFYICPECELSSHIISEDFLEKKVQKILGIKSENLEKSIKKGNIKFYKSMDIPTLQFKKDVGHIESGTVVFLSKNIEVIRGFPKIRRTLMLSPTLGKHFGDEIAVEEKLNGYNVRIACINYSMEVDSLTSSKQDEFSKIVALTRGGYICPFTTKKAQELMDLSTFFKDNPELVLCGEMVGIDNPYVSHDYPEVGKLGFRVFDIRRKLTNDPLTVKEKRELLKEYGLPPVRLFGIFPAEDAVEKIRDIIIQIGLEEREGVVMKHPDMEIYPLKYTASQAHDREIKYAFTFPFDFGRAFFFSRVIREGFQAYEMNESEEELRQRAQRMGESIIYPMMEIIQQIAQGKPAVEDAIIDVETKAEAEEFLRHLNQLGVSAMLIEYNDGKALIRRNHQATTDKVTNYLNGGLY